MKKFISLLLCLALILTSLSLVFAEELSAELEETETIEEVVEPEEPEDISDPLLEVADEPEILDREFEEEVAEETTWFTDVPEDNEYYAVVKDVYEKGLMTGKTEDFFDLETPVTKEMLAAVLYRLAGSPEVEEETTTFYNDTVPGAYYMNAITWLWNNEVFVGLEPHTFGVGRVLTIVEVKDFIKNFTKIQSGSFVFGLDKGELMFTRARLAELLSSYVK